MSQELLQRGIVAVKAGRKAEAYELFKQIVHATPRSEQGWLWLSAVVETTEERRFCLSQVLAINSSNTPAQRGLSVLGPGAMQSPFDKGPDQTKSKEESSPSTNQVKSDNLSLLKRPPSSVDSGSISNIICPHCQFTNPPHFIYCDHCGTTLPPVQSSIRGLKNLSQAPEKLQNRKVLQEQSSIRAGSRAISSSSVILPASGPHEKRSRFSSARIISVLGTLMIIFAGLLPWAQTLYILDTGYYIGVSNTYGLFSTAVAIVALIFLFTVKSNVSAHLLAFLCAGGASFSAWKVFDVHGANIGGRNGLGTDLSVGVYVVFVGTALVAGGFLMSLVLPKKDVEQELFEHREVALCPYCKELIEYDATTCQHCERILPPIVGY